MAKLVWTRTPDDDYNGRPTYEYAAFSEDHQVEFFITWEEIAAFNSDRAAENYASDCATCNPHFEYRVVKKR
jgi:hypothetical protein